MTLEKRGSSLLKKLVSPFSFWFLFPESYTKTINLLYIYKQGYTVKQIKTRWKKVEPAMEGDARGQDRGDHLAGNVQHLVEHIG